MATVSLSGAEGELRLDRFPVSSGPGSQIVPRVSGRYVVWLDYRAPHSPDRLAEVYGRDLAGGQELRIASDAPAYAPAVSGHRAVFTAYDQGRTSFDIRGYDFELGETFAVVEADGHQLDPAIDGNIVVWEDDRTGKSEIRGRDLARGVDFVVSNHLGDQRQPSISHGIVVWEDTLTITDFDAPFHFNRSNIAYKDLRTGRGGRITDDGDSERPSISGQWIAYVNGPTDDATIKLYSLHTNETRTVATGLKLTHGPRISNNLVVWSSFDGEWRDDARGSVIWAYNTDSRQTMRLTATKGADLSPDIAGDMLVWESRGPRGSANIVGARLTWDE